MWGPPRESCASLADSVGRIDREFPNLRSPAETALGRTSSWPYLDFYGKNFETKFYYFGILNKMYL